MNIKDRIFFLSMAIWFLAITLIGFATTFYLPDTNRQVSPHILFHGIIFTVWIILFLTQSVLISSKNIKWHFNLGWFGLLLSIIIFFSGVYISFMKKPMYLNEVGNNLSYIITFLLFVLLGIKYKSKPYLHKRLLVFATMMLTSAAVARINILGIDLGANYLAYYVVMFLPILALFAYDAGSLKKKLKIDVLCLIFVVLMILGTNLIWETQVWSVIVHEIIVLLK